MFVPQVKPPGCVVCGNVREPLSLGMPPPSILESGQEMITRDCNNYFSVVMQCHVQKQLEEERVILMYSVGGIESIMVGKARCRRRKLITLHLPTRMRGTYSGVRGREREYWLL